MTEDLSALIFKHSRAKHTAKLVLLALAHALGGREEVQITNERLRELTGVTMRTIMRQLHELERLGEIERTYPAYRGTPRGPAMAPVYRLPKLDEWRRGS